MGDAAQEDGEDAGRIAADAVHIASDQGLHDQALDRPDEQGGGGLDIQAWVELAGVATAPGGTKQGAA